MAGRQSVVEEGEAMAAGHRENFVLHIAIERSPVGEELQSNVIVCPWCLVTRAPPVN